MRKFVAIMNIPSPYRVYLFEVLSKVLSGHGYAFEANFMARGHAERPKSWLNPKMTFPFRYWRDIGYKCHHFNLGLIIRSWFSCPDVLLVGSPFDTFTGIVTALTSRARVKCTWVEGQTKTPGELGGVRGFVKRLVLSRFKYVAVPGRDAAGYIALHQKRTRLCMPKPVFLPNLVDESRFRPRSEWPTREIDRCRELFKAGPNDRVCLIPARLDAVKGLAPFLEAVDADLINNGWRIVIMGQGPLKKTLQEKAYEKGISDRLVILDYVPYDQMPICYAAADLFLLPSLHDPNPLSVPEALHSALPVAISDRCGNVEEGCSDEVNGWVLPVLESDRFRHKLRDVFQADLCELRKRGIRSKQNNAKFWDSISAVESFIGGLNE